MLTDTRGITDPADLTDTMVEIMIRLPTIDADATNIDMLADAGGITIATMSADAMIKHMGFPTVHMIGIFKNAIRTSIDFITIHIIYKFINSFCLI